MPAKSKDETNLLALFVIFWYNMSNGNFQNKFFMNKKKS